MQLLEIEAKLTGPGGPFETVEQDVLGERMTVFKSRAPSLRALLERSVDHGDKLYIEAQLPTPEASATSTIIEGELNEQGQLKGTFRYGVDGARPMNLPMIGRGGGKWPSRTEI